jgi:uncharacterized protein YndB with AHSA1/START domain
MKKLHFSINIKAPIKKVWHTMLDDSTYRQWTTAFHAGSFYEGDWQTGSIMKFLGPDENGSLGGMLGTIAENRPYEFVSVKYHGFVMNGVEDTTSEAVKKWTGGTENYSFKEVDGSTEVSVELDFLQVKKI